MLVSRGSVPLRDPETLAPYSDIVANWSVHSNDRVAAISDFSFWGRRPTGEFACFALRHRLVRRNFAAGSMNTFGIRQRDMPMGIIAANSRRGNVGSLPVAPVSNLMTARLQ